MTFYHRSDLKRDPVQKIANLSVENKLILITLSALTAWFGLASLFWGLYPDATLSITGNLSAFMKFGSRNSLIFLIVFSFLSTFTFLFKSKSEPLLQYVRRSISENKDDIPKNIIKLGIGIASFCVFLCSYSMIKTRIPEIVPYKWDVFFARLDQIIFFGKDPWLFFTWVYDTPSLLIRLDQVYNIWAALFAGSWVCAFVGSRETMKRRYKYILALMLTWFIGGNLIAILLSSAGPCYYGLVTGQVDIFAPQMEILRNIGNLHFIEYQDLLWSVYQSPQLGMGGISAMPSMHCATSFLFVLMYGRTPITRALTIIFFMTILCSSVILAWHYAVDGLLGMLIAFICWKLAGRIVTRVSR